MVSVCIASFLFRLHRNNFIIFYLCVEIYAFCAYFIGTRGVRNKKSQSKKLYYGKISLLGTFFFISGLCVIYSITQSFGYAALEQHLVGRVNVKKN
jgi:formate hydrogenlyase subunit 3/multisubunit Na+/H+ antiporter MnhD subunit